MSVGLTYVERLPVAEIKPYHLARRKRLSLQWLHDDIADRGILDPTLVREDGVVEYGESRYEIALTLGIQTVKAFVRGHYLGGETILSADQVESKFQADCSTKAAILDYIHNGVIKLEER